MGDKTGNIKHVGRIVEIKEGIATVEFVNKSACAQCHAKMICGASDESLKRIEALADPSFALGDEVNILLRSSLGSKAVWITYVIPLIILLVLLLSLQPLFSNELIMGLSCIVALGLYFFIIYLCKGKFDKEYVFTIEKI